MSKAKWAKIPQEQLKQYVEESYSYRELATKCGYSPNGGTYLTAMKDMINQYNFDVSHFTGQGWNGHSNHETHSREGYKIEEIFCKNSPVTQKVMRGYVERHNLLEYKCVFCGCDGHWQGGEISLEIDHIDGDSSNNDLSNLRYLCPNCHALTSTYRGRNKALKNK